MINVTRKRNVTVRGLTGVGESAATEQADNSGLGGVLRMKSRDAAVRMMRFQIDERRRQVGQIETMIEEFGRMVSDLDLEIAAEHRRTGIDDEKHFAYSTFARAARQRRANLQASVADLTSSSIPPRRRSTSPWPSSRRKRRSSSATSGARCRAATPIALPADRARGRANRRRFELSVAAGEPLVDRQRLLLQPLQMRVVERGAGAAARSRSSGSPRRTNAAPRSRRSRAGPAASSALPR